MVSCFKNLLKPKTAAKEDIGTPKDHEAKQKVQPAIPASEGFRDKSPGNSAVGSDRQSRNLCEEAFAKLDDVQRDSLSNIEESQEPSVVQSVADETRNDTVNPIREEGICLRIKTKMTLLQPRRYCRPCFDPSN